MVTASPEDGYSVSDYLPSPLPPAALSLCRRCAASPILVRHLEVVHDTALDLLKGLEKQFPALTIERDAVLFGAATHDLGKVLHPSEISAPGNLHEREGPELLLSLGVPEKLARFARTHGRWSPEHALEDLLVALADSVWKGRRASDLESVVAARIADQADQTQWQIYIRLDDVLGDIASHSVARLSYAAR